MKHNSKIDNLSREGDGREEMALSKCVQESLKDSYQPIYAYTDYVIPSLLSLITLRSISMVKTPVKT